MNTLPSIKGQIISNIATANSSNNPIFDISDINIRDSIIRIIQLKIIDIINVRNALI